MGSFNWEGFATNIELGVSCETARKIVKAKQNDASRQLNVTIKDDNDNYFFYPDTLTVSNDKITLRVQRADGELVEIEQSIDWTENQGVYEMNTQFFTITAEALGAAGRAYCDLLIEYTVTIATEVTDYSFSTEPFYIDVEAMPTDASTSDVGYGAYNETQGEIVSDNVTEVTV